MMGRIVGAYHSFDIILRLTMSHQKISITTLSSHLFQLTNRTNHVYLSIFIFPNWQGRGPVTITRNCPIGSILYDIEKSSMFKMIRYPVNLFIKLDHPPFYLLNIDKPGT